jgi:hypothetical protein
VAIARAPGHPGTRAKSKVATEVTPPTTHWNVGVPSQAKGIRATWISTMEPITLTRVGRVASWGITRAEKHVSGKLRPGKFFWEVGRYTQRVFAQKALTWDTQRAPTKRAPGMRSSAQKTTVNPEVNAGWKKLGFEM